MNDFNGVRFNRKRHAPRRRAAKLDLCWLLALSSLSTLFAIGCGDKGEIQVTGNRGQGGAAGITGSCVGRASGSNKIGSVGGSLSGAGGMKVTGEKNGTEGAIGGGTGGGSTSDTEEQSAASGVGCNGGQSGSDGTAVRRPPCITKGSQIVLAGDSYINWITHTFPEDMNEVVGKPVRDYAIGGFSMGSGGLGMIPPQLDQAIAEDPDIIAVVMDGGGNDILVPDILQFPRGLECKSDPNSPSIPDCQAIVKLAMDATVKAMDKLVVAGIPDAVYFFYPRVPSTWLAESPNEILEYALPMAKEVCDTAYTRTQGKLNCYFVDMTPVFEGHPEYFAEADLHPNSEGSTAMAKKIWEVMVDKCIAQPESNGCCAP